MKKSLTEAREIIVLHETLINRLSEQNDKLKQLCKSKSKKNKRAISREVEKADSIIQVQKDANTSIFDKIKDSDEKSIRSTKSALSIPSNEKSKRDSKGSASPIPHNKNNIKKSPTVKQTNFI